MLTLFAGPALAPVLLLALGCAPQADSAAETSSFEIAVRALRRGDLEGLRASLRHDSAHQAWAAAQAVKTDPAAWLIVMGASRREHDPAVCARALEGGQGLLDALSFGEQAMRADILDAGRTVFTRRSGGLDYYETSDSPLSALDPALAPPLPPGLRAYELEYWLTRKGRAYRLRLGRNQRGLSNIQATLDSSASAAVPPPGGARSSTPGQAAGGLLHGLRLPGLEDDAWWALEARLAGPAGELTHLRLGRDAGGWCVLQAAATTLRERLEGERDRRLERIRAAAVAAHGATGRWPVDLNALGLRARELVDPAAAEGRLGWAELAAKPQATFRLLPAQGDADIAVAGPPGESGRSRAITRGGKLGWHGP